MKQISISSFIITICIAVFSYGITGRAALVLEQVSYLQNNPEKKGRGTIYISDNKIKFTENITNSTVVFDIGNDKLIKIDNESKTYAVTSPEKYVKAIYDQWLEEKQKLKIEVSNLPKEKRDHQINILKNRGIDIYGKDKPPKLTFMDSEANEIIANHKVKNYKVYRDKTLIEEYWLSNSIKDIDYDKFAKFYSEMQRITNIIYLDSENPENIINILQSLYKNGFPLKSVDYQTNGNRVEEIIDIRNIDLLENYFSPPAGYKEVSF